MMRPRRWTSTSKHAGDGRTLRTHPYFVASVVGCDPIPERGSPKGYRIFFDAPTCAPPRDNCRESMICATALPCKPFCAGTGTGSTCNPSCPPSRPIWGTSPSSRRNITLPSSSPSRRPPARSSAATVPQYLGIAQRWEVQDESQIPQHARPRSPRLFCRLFARCPRGKPPHGEKLSGCSSA